MAEESNKDVLRITTTDITPCLVITAEDVFLVDEGKIKRLRLDLDHKTTIEAYWLRDAISGDFG